MLNDKKVISDKSVLFALTEPKLHYIRVAPEKEEYLKVWVKEPTWLEAEKALNAVMKIDSRTQSLDLDLNAMYRYMVENFISKTEPSLSSVDMLRLSPYVGNQIKEILPNPMSMMQEDEEKNE
jgi:hypothetical protein